MNFKPILLFIIISFSAKAQTFESAKENLKGKYQYISYPKKNIVTFREHNGKMGVMDSLCNITAPAKFDYTELSCNGRIEAGIEKQGKMKCGYINKNGEILVPLIYDDAYIPCDSELIIVSNNDKKGLVDINNTIIIPLEYSFITYANEERYIVEKAKHYAFFNNKGEALSGFDFIDAERYYNKTAVVTLPNNSATLIDLNGKTLFAPLTGYSIQSSTKDTYKIYDKKAKKYGFTDRRGNFIIPCDYDNADHANELFKLQKNKLWGLYNRNHEAVTALKYEYIFATSGNMFICKDKNWGVLNALGNYIIPAEYERIENHDDKYFIAKNTAGKFGVFSLDGKNTVPFEYDFYRIWKHKAFCTKEGKPVIVDITTGTITKADADSFTKSFDTFSEKWDKQIFIKNGKYGVLSIDNTILIPARYEMLESIYISGEFIAKQNGKFGIIDIKETIKQPFEYDKIKVIKENALLTKKNNKPVYYNIKHRDYAIDFKVN